MLEILKAEYASLPLWLRFALEYFKQGKTDQFKQILFEGTSPEIDEIEVYRDKKGDRIALLNTLAAFYTQLGRQEKDKARRDDYFEQATSHYNKAVRVRANWGSVYHKWLTTIDRPLCREHPGRQGSTLLCAW